ncbi:alpha/beta hydrolase family protein [Streptomyces sp. GC420]|uniref:alpha/beta hydrolase n=1 Tax=Streptomyces sp. GC420 TaxID=2697568 RepID=UPI001414E9CE|nr:alpha/beta hydrolase family protein [Streptomyces sp. GC420]NBM17297.1 esterase family protein [Streptomyces sp. GC420]
MGADLPVRVILPKNWKKGGSRTFPVLYLLQGASDDYTSWTRETDVEQLAADSDMLVVMPDGGRAGFYTDWWDHGRANRPRWETFHTVELRQLMERRYRANTARAVIGLSEGGLGALNYAAHNPGVFRFAGSFSGIVDTSDPLMRFAFVATCMREGVDPLRIWGHPDDQREVWDAHNPSTMTDRFKGTRVHLSAGSGRRGDLDQDGNPLASLLEQPLPRSTEAFSQALGRAGVKVTLNLYDHGTHSWPYWERELHVVWPGLESLLKARRTG